MVWVLYVCACALCEKMQGAVIEFLTVGVVMTAIWDWSGVGHIEFLDQGHTIN